MFDRVLNTPLNNFITHSSTNERERSWRKILILRASLERFFLISSFLITQLINPRNLESTTFFLKLVFHYLKNVYLISCIENVSRLATAIDCQNSLSSISDRKKWWEIFQKKNKSKGATYKRISLFLVRLQTASLWLDKKLSVLEQYTKRIKSYVLNAYILNAWVLSPRCKWRGPLQSKLPSLEM